jgi:hypothetical protein
MDYRLIMNLLQGMPHDISGKVMNNPVQIRRYQQAFNIIDLSTQMEVFHNTP